MARIIAPSILSADFLKLGEEIDLLNDSKAEWIHLDIMDGMFVPNISFGFPIMESVRKVTDKVLDVHLMIEQPERYISKFKKSGANILTVHWETCPHLHRTIQDIKENKMKAGVSLNPHSPVSLLENILPELDLVLIMSVNPGFGGQSFISESLKKISTLRNMIDKQNLNTIIEVDGGVDLESGQKLVNAGADALVAGSFVFSSKNPKQTIENLQNLEKDR